MARIEAGQVDDALAILRSQLQRLPSDGHAHALVGICHAQQGNLEASVKSLETAAILNPGDPAVEYNLACALFQIGRTDQARWRLTRILESDPENQEARQLLAHVQRPTAPAAPAAAPAAPGRATAPAARYPAAHRSPSESTAIVWPGLGLRMLRGTGWGLLYSLWWTVFSLCGAFLLSLFATKVAVAIVAFALMAVMTTVFHSAMGILTGLLVAVLNVDHDAGAWVGFGVGILILVLGMLVGMLAFWAVAFYICSGWLIGRAIADRVQRPLTA